MLRPAVSLLLMALCLASAASSAVAQGNNNGGNNGNNNAGGVLIDPDGVLQPMQVTATLKPRRRPGTNDADAGAICVSLRRLNELIGQSDPEAFPPEAFVLGGLTRIDQIVVDADARDVFLIGPGESQATADTPNFVGEMSGRPLMRTGDFLTMIGSARSGRFLVRCSIDPEQSRLKAYNDHIRATVASVSFNNAAAWYQGLARILGRQIVTVGGVPEDSRISNVLAAADYSMKRIALGIEPSGVREIKPQLAYAAGDTGAQMKRWWFAPQYDDVAVSSDRTVFQFSGPRVKLLAQEELILGDGRRVNSDRNRPSTEAFARQFSEHFEELTAVRPIFADLKNQFDLAVAASLLVREKLLDRFDLPLQPAPELMKVLMPSCPVPRFVESGANIRRVSKGTIIGVVGGVEISPTAVLADEAPLNDTSVRPTRPTPENLSKSQFSWRLDVP